MIWPYVQNNMTNQWLEGKCFKWQLYRTVCMHTIFSVSIVFFKNSIRRVYSFITSELGLLERNERYVVVNSNSHDQHATPTS